MQYFDAAYRHCCDRRDWNPSYEKLERRTRDVYDVLKETARAEDVIQYGQLAERVGTDKRRYMSCILDAIGYVEMKKGNPPLTALVVRKGRDGEGVPSDGFVTLLDELGLRDRYTAQTERGLFEEAKADVYREWSE